MSKYARAAWLPPAIDLMRTSPLEGHLFRPKSKVNGIRFEDMQVTCLRILEQHPAATVAMRVSFEGALDPTRCGCLTLELTTFQAWFYFEQGDVDDLVDGLIAMERNILIGNRSNPQVLRIYDEGYWAFESAATVDTEYQRVRSH